MITTPTLSTKSVFSQFSQRIHQQPKQTPWSTAELRITESDYRLLCQWFAGLDETEWQYVEHSGAGEIAGSGICTGINAGSLLIFILFAECAKRHAKENVLWSSISRLQVLPAVRPWLFQSNNQPTAWLKHILYDAAFYWNLRHLFDQPGHQAWFCTLYLQFGFTDWAVDKRLPLWLSGQTSTVAVENLLTSPTFQSHSFCTIWNALKNYRHSRINETRCRESLENSAWVNNESIPQLLKSAKSRLDLLEVTHRPYASDGSYDLLSEFTLEWSLDNETPRFKAEICATDLLELSESVYELRAEGIETTRVIRQDDGEYMITGGRFLELPFTRSLYNVSFVALREDGSEKVEATQSISLWDHEQPVNIYKKSGRYVEVPDKIEQLPEGAFLITPSTFKVLPAATRCHSNESGWSLHQLPKCDYSNLKVELDGEAVWWPDNPSFIHTGDKPEITSYIDTKSPKLKWNHFDPNFVDIVVNVSYGASINWARLGTDVLDLEQITPERYLAKGIKIDARTLYNSTKVCCSLSVNGRNFRAETPLETRAELPLMRHNESDSVFRYNKILSTHLAATSLFKCARLTPSSHDGNTRNDYILEGSKVVKLLSQRELNLPHLDGYGEELAVYRGYYNHERKIYTVADQVIDTGIIKSVQITADGIYIQPRHEIDISDHHTIYIWNDNKEIVKRQLTENPDVDSEYTWFSPHPIEEQLAEFTKSILTIALFYQGERIGSWFGVKDWSTPLKFNMTREQAITTAEMLRWFKAPIASKFHRNNVVTFLRHNMARTLPTWLSNDVSPNEQFSSMNYSEKWIDLIGGLCFEAGIGESIDLTAASQIIEDISPNYDPSRIDETLVGTLTNLGTLSPFLIKVIIQRLIQNEVQSGNRLKAIKAKEAIVSATTVSKTELEHLYKSLDVDEYFFRHALGKIVLPVKKLTDTELHNNRILLTNPTVRRIITHSFLKSISL